MLGNLSLLNQTFIEVQDGTLASRLVLCAMGLTRAPHLPQQELDITTHLKTHSLVFTTHILTVQVMLDHQKVVIAARLQMDLFQGIILTIIYVNLVEVTCQSRQLMKYHSAPLMGSEFLKSDLLVFESYHNNQSPHMQQYLYKVGHCEKANVCIYREKITNTYFVASSGL